MPSSSVKGPIVVVGLGNPGKKYEKTRHNLGYLVLQDVAKKLGWQWKEEKRFSALACKGTIGDRTVHLLLPTTYMNNSGNAVRKYLEFFKLDASSVIVVADDIALKFGQMRVRASGSAGGHNGLQSIQDCLGTTHYVRLRMGIGPSQPLEQEVKIAQDQDLSDYVLGPFSQREKKELEAFLSRGVEVVEMLFSKEVHSVMNAVNQRIKKQPEGGSGEQV